MAILQANTLVQHLKSLIHQPTQQHHNHIDLTVESIHNVNQAGSLDFGGSEFKAAQTIAIEPQKKNPSDDYGWWHLRKGTYKAVMNEGLKDIDDKLAIISPHNHFVEAGIIAHSLFISGGDTHELENLELNFQVPEAGCNIKENARIATLYIIED